MKAAEKIAAVTELIDRLEAETDSIQQRLLRTRIQIALEALVGIDKDPDAGPWFVSADGRTLQSDDFDHDVMLEVKGDFYSDESRRAYSIALARVLSQQRSNLRFVTLPIKPSREVLASMALRYRHDFGLDADDRSPMSSGTTEAEREAILRTMAQLYDEVVRHHIHNS